MSAPEPTRAEEPPEAARVMKPVEVRAARRQRRTRPPAAGGAMNREDQEFLPAALEILERPASPVGRALILIICGMAVAALAWSWLGWSDVVAVASGKVQPTGRVKTVQFLEPGRVKTVLAENGKAVRQGDPLIELDPSEVLEDIRALEASIHSLSAEVIRREKSLRMAQRTALPEPKGGVAEIPAAIRLREEGLQRGEIQGHFVRLQYLEGMQLQKKAERQRILGTLEPMEKLIAVLQERVNTRTELARSQFVSHAAVLDAAEELHKQRAALARERGQLGEVDRAIEVLDLERERLRSDFMSENLLKSNDAQRQLDDLGPRLAKALQRLERLTVRSPVDGVVHASTITSLGQVIQAGQEIMRIVPQDGKVEVEVYVPNKDIAFIKPGQEVSIKIEAYPYTKYGIVTGRVKRIANDAIPEPDARQLEGDPTRMGPSLQAAGGQRVSALVYPVVISADHATLKAGGQTVPMIPGMAVSAEIKTSQRRIIEYVLSPIQQMTSESMRER